ncbi:sensor histidine kinase [Atopomonas sediminilitoris]|uniref:sensor histidine kinase n=1 Tax=Atopomonas sediminilitoris TaxID=2919919 RepID=UPI001F4D3FCD|nr:HAMP domain-containing sensor histidine kinase [Atopomonas sediminilitoris]MCJ8169486.1 ATP-binding protein [Atopomonas sediminilitoris]
MRGSALRLARPAAALLACGGYALLAVLSMQLSAQPSSVAGFWFANALAVALLLAYPQREWWLLLAAIALGNALSNAVMGSGWLRALQFVPGNLLEVLCAAWLLRRSGKVEELWSSPLAMLAVLAVAALLLPLLGATVGAAVLSLNATLGYDELWLRWYLGDALGMITLLPLLLGFNRIQLERLQRFGVLECASLCLLSVAVAVLALSQLPFPFAFVLLPLLLCAMLAPVLLTALAVWLVTLSMALLLALGEFVPPPITTHWQNLWLFLPMIALVLAPLLLACALEQGRQRERALAHQGMLLEEAGSLASLGAWEQQWPSGEVYWSAQLSHILALKTPCSWESLLPSFALSSRQLLARALQKASVSGAPWELELEYCPAGQARRIVQVLGRVESRGTGQQRWWGVVRDITAQKELDQLKSQFVATVSHELRTPLTAMRGALDLLEHTQGEQLPEAGRNLLEIASRNTKRLGELVNLILDLEKLRAGRLEVQVEPMDMAAAIAESLSNLQPYAQKYQVRFAFTPPQAPLYALGDQLRVQQVLSNLMSNAAKFASTDSEVELSLSVHQPGTQDECVQVAVRNQGEPIAQAFREHIFQPFRQADGSDVRQRQGTGLGLSISRALVEAMHGEIGFSSDAEHGTCFWFRLLPAQS